MGWATCGEDSMGRPIGYAYDAVCDHPGCTKKIHRGLAYVCGGDMHGDTERGCEKYFCEKHLTYTVVSDDDIWAPVCTECRGIFVAEISQHDVGERAFENAKIGPRNEG